MNRSVISFVPFNRWSAAVLTVWLAPLTIVQAQYVGPGAMPVITSLAQVLAHPVDDQRVRLQGYLVKQLSSDKYLFSNGKEHIRVEIDHDQFPPRALGADVRVLIEGEVEKDFMESPEIDVDRLVLKP